MGRTLFILLLAIIHLSPIINSVIAVNLNKGFSLKMIHRDSKESPLYRGDHLTREERLERLFEQSKSQARYIQSQILLQSNATGSMNPEVASLPVVYDPRMYYYIAKVGLGEFPIIRQPYMHYYLLVDTGSDQTWLQCEGAVEFFDQDMQLYPWNSSFTFRFVPCNTHPLCTGDKCNADGQCTYRQRYVGGQTTSGLVAEEKFTLGSINGGFESIVLQMGCGFDQKNFKSLGNNRFYGKPDLIAGILGLGSGQFSFVNQLGAMGQGKFSYCFETFNQKIQGSDTYLRFGADASIGGVGQTVHRTPIFMLNSLYYLNLQDISVGNRKVGFATGTFERNSQGQGGAIIDSGAPLSTMFKEHFDRVAFLVKAHFHNLGVAYVVGGYKNFQCCFRLRGRFNVANYPTITLHFQGGANYVISDYKANFLAFDDIVCLGIYGRDTHRLFILGAMQQANKRILYNVMDRSLSFATEYCELDS